jgi:hypothetical protein
VVQITPRNGWSVCPAISGGEALTWVDAHAYPDRSAGANSYSSLKGAAYVKVPRAVPT